MTAHVRAPQKLSSADLENLKAEIVDDITAQLKTYITEFLAEQVAIQNDRSVTAFCRRWSFSRFLFYDKPDEMPATMHVGGRTLISPEAEARWVKEREAAAKTAPKRLIGKSRTARTADRERAAAAKHQAKEAAE
jgi:hypothetical protein